MNIKITDTDKEMIKGLIVLLNTLEKLATLPQDKVINLCNDFMKNYLNYSGEQSLFFSEGYRDGFDHATLLLKLVMGYALGCVDNSTIDERMATLVEPLFNDIIKKQDD